MVEEEITYEKIDKLSDKLKVGDAFRIGDILVEVLRVRTNDKDEKILDLDIIGAKFKKRSKAMLIIPKQIPIETETLDIVGTA